MRPSFHRGEKWTRWYWEGEDKTTSAGVAGNTRPGNHRLFCSLRMVDKKLVPFSIKRGEMVGKQMNDYRRSSSSA